MVAARTSQKRNCALAGLFVLREKGRDGGGEGGAGAGRGRTRLKTMLGLMSSAGQGALRPCAGLLGRENNRAHLLT